MFATGSKEDAKALVYYRSIMLSNGNSVFMIVHGQYIFAVQPFPLIHSNMAAASRECKLICQVIQIKMDALLRFTRTKL